MNRIMVCAAALALSGCASETVVQAVGLDYGRRYAWAKEGASDIDRQRALFVCSAENEGELRQTLMAGSVPFVGLVLVPATVLTTQHIAKTRAECMQAAGWQLVDVVSGQPQRLAADSWGDLRPQPR